jgi:hypothetical protein
MDGRGGSQSAVSNTRLINPARQWVVIDFEPQFVAANNGFVSAANNGQPKSPARQQCEANAQSSYSDTLENTAWQNTFVPFKAAGAGAISGGIIGCVLTVEGGCFEGAIPGALTGLFGGAVEGTIQAVSSDIKGYRQAKGQLAAALAACQQIP